MLRIPARLLFKAEMKMFFKRPKQTLNDNSALSPPAGPSVIARDTVLEGNISANGEIRIEGSVRGSIRAQVCVIETTGVVEGEVLADEIIVRGRVVGPMRATHAHLHSGADVEGDIVSNTIAIDTGARLQGSVWRSEDSFANETSNSLATLEPREQPSYLRNPLWAGTDDANYRPIVAVRPR